MQKLLTRTAGVLIFWSYTACSIAQYPVQWDLRSSIEEALRQAPQLQATNAEINARQSQLDEAGAWPNPRVVVAVDNTVSLEQGSNGYAFSKFDLIQPLPIGRLGAETRQAHIALSAAQSQKRYNFLEIEKITANVFYALQYHTALLKLTEQKYNSLEQLLRDSEDPLVRYFSETERKRLGILREQAHQAAAAAEGEYRETVSQFRALLALPDTYIPKINSLQPAPSPQHLDMLLASLANHPLLTSLQQSEAAAETGIDVARAQRRIDPELIFYSTRDVYAGREQTSTGLAIKIEIPFWQSNDRKIARARAKFHKQQAELKIQRRDLNNRLHRGYLHLQHLIEQAQHYRLQVLVPAREILQLSSRGFRSGEIDLLNFIDAHNTYYDAQSKYMMLIYQGWLETAEVRYSAGQMLAEMTQ